MKFYHNINCNSELTLGPSLAISIWKLWFYYKYYGNDVDDGVYSFHVDYYPGNFINEPERALSQISSKFEIYEKKSSNYAHLKAKNKDGDRVT